MLAPVLAIALNPDPAGRYPNASAFLAALDEAATRRYGPTWWTQADLGAAAAGSIAGVTAMGVAATAASPAAQTSIAATGNSPAATAPSYAQPYGVAAKAARVGSKAKIFVAAGSVAAVAAVGVAAYAVTNNSSDNKDVAKKITTSAPIVPVGSTSPGSSTPTPTPPRTR